MYLIIKICINYFFLDIDGNSLNEENSLESVKGIFAEIQDSIGISQINIEDNNDVESGKYLILFIIK